MDSFASSTYDTIVIGAGQAGLATAHFLQRAGLNFTILESTERIGGAWRYYYDSLKLFSPVEYSNLPGLAMDGDPNRYPLRDEIVAYLERYTRHHAFPIITGAHVVTVSQKREMFEIKLKNGDSFVARTVVIATGSFQRPNQPKFPGQSLFNGKILHAGEYTDPTPFEGERLIVVGSRNSAVQIGVELAQVADVTIASRDPISYVPKRLFGKDIHFWLTRTGFDSLPIGQWFDFSMKESVVDDGRYEAAIGQNRPDRRPMFIAFQKDGVVWEDGKFEAVDTVLFATGYQPNLDFLNGLGRSCKPIQLNDQGGASKSVPGLYFVGFPWQRSHRSGTLRGVGPDADYVVGRLQRYLKSRIG